MGTVALASKAQLVAVDRGRAVRAGHTALADGIAEITAAD